MKRLITCIIVTFVVISCNSKEKKSTKIKYPEKTYFSSEGSDLKESIKRGQLVYNDLCITCHMSNGKGAPKVFPPLANSDYLKDNQQASIIGIKRGVSGKMIVNGITYNSVMSPLGLNDEEVADVMNYINNSWGNNYGEIITSEDVTKVIKKQ